MLQSLCDDGGGISLTPPSAYSILFVLLLERPRFGVNTAVTAKLLLTTLLLPRLSFRNDNGDDRCGQTQLAAAALHLLDGVPVHSLALHSLHGDPSRTAEASLVSRFVEARRNVPSVLYLPGAHQWWDGEDAAVHPHLRCVPLVALILLLVSQPAILLHASPSLHTSQEQKPTR